MSVLLHIQKVDESGMNLFVLYQSFSYDVLTMRRMTATELIMQIFGWSTDERGAQFLSLRIDEKYRDQGCSGLGVSIMNVEHSDFFLNAQR